VAKVLHAASALGASALSLGGPVECALAGLGVTACTTVTVLDVHGATAAPLAEGVGLVVPFTERGSTFSLRGGNC